MKIIEAFSEEGMRLTFGHRWMTWDSLNKGWIIYERKPYQKKTRVILKTVSERDAVNCLRDQ